MDRTVICSHGFGVDKTGRGLFTDIAAAFPELQFDMFDYNDMDEKHQMTVYAIDLQAKVLDRHLQDAEGKVTLLCHSQGCVTAGLAEDLGKVDRVIFLAPPDNLDIERFSKIFGSRAGAEFNPDGVSVIPRRDGSKTFIGKDYIDSIRAVDVMEAYKRVAEQCELTIIRAEDDEIVGDTSFPGVQAKIFTMPGGHDFRTNRSELIQTLEPLLKD